MGKDATEGVDEKLLSHWELGRKKCGEGAKSCSILQSLDPMARGESDEITAIPTVTKESSNGDFRGSSVLGSEVLPLVSATGLVRTSGSEGEMTASEQASACI